MMLLRGWYYQHRAAFLLSRMGKLVNQYQVAIECGDSWAEGYIRSQIEENDRALSLVLDRWDAVNAARRDAIARGAR